MNTKARVILDNTQVIPENIIPIIAIISNNTELNTLSIYITIPSNFSILLILNNKSLPLNLFYFFVTDLLHKDNIIFYICNKNLTELLQVS